MMTVSKCFADREDEDFFWNVEKVQEAMISQCWLKLSLLSKMTQRVQHGHNVKYEFTQKSALIIVKHGKGTSVCMANNTNESWDLFASVVVGWCTYWFAWRLLLGVSNKEEYQFHMHRQSCVLK